MICYDTTIEKKKNIPDIEDQVRKKRRRYSPMGKPEFILQYESGIA